MSDARAAAAAPGRRRRATARVVVGRVEAPPIEAPTTLGRRLGAALVPATRVTRYRREWLLGQVSRQERTILGRVGYNTDENVDGWDEEAQDFHRTAVTLGQASPFALNLATGVVAFQVRATISATAFAGALALLLSAGEGVPGWHVSVEEDAEDIRGVRGECRPRRTANSDPQPSEPKLERSPQRRGPGGFHGLGSSHGHHAGCESEHR